MIHDIDTWRTIALGFAALGQTAFALLYMTFPWWRTFLGRALFYKALMLSILLDVIWLGRTFDFGWNDKVFVPLYGLLALGVWAQFLAFLKVKKQESDPV